MKLKLIIPAKNPESRNYDFLALKQLATLTGRTIGGMNLSLPTLAALTPDDVEVAITDENIEPIDFDSRVDLVGISFLSPVASRAYEISQKFREKGIPVVLGGIHTSLFSQEASKFADSIVIGEAEDIWAGLINDFKNGSLKKVYRTEEFPNLDNLVVPRWDLMKIDQYSSFSVQTGRGCPYGCDFCLVKVLNGEKIRRKPVKNVIKELKFLKKLDSRKPIFFSDDNLLAIPKYAKDLLINMQPLELKDWWCQTSIDRLKNRELVHLLYKAGCSVVFVGFESISQSSLKSMGKSAVNIVEEYEEVIGEVHNSGIAVFGSFIFGTDNDSVDIFKRTADFINKNDMVYAMVNILTPTPGSELYKKLDEQNRLIIRDWQKYNGETVCFKPKNMTVEELEAGRIWLLNEIYSYKSLYKRLKALWNAGALIRRGDRRKLLTKGRVLFTLRALPSKNIKRSMFIVKSLWNRKITSVGSISLALSFHDYADGLKGRLGFANFRQSALQKKIAQR